MILSQNQSRYSIREIEVYGVPANITDAGDSPSIISDYKLYQNYPNPFNPSSMISYRIPTAGFVKIKVYNILGTEVKILVDEYKKAGNYAVEFDGSGLASGVYFYQLEVNGFISSKRMLLLK